MAGREFHMRHTRHMKQANSCSNKIPTFRKSRTGFNVAKILDDKVPDSIVQWYNSMIIDKNKT